MHLDRIILVLETVALAGRPITPAEVQTATGIPRPTCYRLLKSLEETGLVEGGDRRGFTAGSRLARLSALARPDAEIGQQTAPVLRDVAAEIGEAVFLSRIRETGVEIIQVEVPGDAARSYVHPGLGFRPIHACSCAKVIAAFADDGFRKAILGKGLRRLTGHTCTDPEALETEFDRIRQTGYAECVEEVEIGVSSVAARVDLGAAGSPFSVGATGPIRRFSPLRREELGGILLSAAERISGLVSLTGPIGRPQAR